MPFPEDIFRSYDIRGTIDQLSEDLAFRIGVAIVRLTGAKTVVVGRDMRPTSPAFSQKVIEGITSQGANAVDIGMCSTSMFNFAVSAFHEYEAGVMVTASHNPPEYNGFKVSKGDGSLIRGVDLKEPVAEEIGELTGGGEVSERDISADYLDKLFAEADMPSLKGLKVVIDAGNGMAGVILPKLFEKLDCEMMPMYFEPDGTFPNHEANPIKVETLKDLQTKLKEEGADLGIALDGDADRVGFIDEKGVPIGGDILMGLLIVDRLKAHAGAPIVWSPNASWAIRDAIEKHGGVGLLEKVGRTNIIARMQKEEAALGGEVSAHYFYPEFSCLESTDFTILLILKLLAESGGTMSDLMEPYRKYARSEEINFEVEDKDGVLAALKKHYEGEAKEVNELDGVRIEFADWWFNIRKSNTEPIVRLNLEASSVDQLKEKTAELSGFITSHA